MMIVPSSASCRSNRLMERIARSIRSSQPGPAISSASVRLYQPRAKIPILPAAGIRFQNRHMSGCLFSSTDGDPIEKSVQPRGSKNRISSWIDIVIPEAFQPSTMITTGIFSSRS